jgi:hypothetical protein
MKGEKLRTKKEKMLFGICFCFSLISWIAMVMSLVGILYGVAIGFFLMVAHAMMIAHIKGHALKLSTEQLPEIFNRVVEAARKLGVEKVPEI